ncbi:hypothetical protein ACOME3_001528 [Neoechinorhynchus agilis]
MLKTAKVIILFLRNNSAQYPFFQKSSKNALNLATPSIRTSVRTQIYKHLLLQFEIYCAPRHKKWENFVNGRPSYEKDNVHTNAGYPQYQVKNSAGR